MTSKETNGPTLAGEDLAAMSPDERHDAIRRAVNGEGATPPLPPIIRELARAAIAWADADRKADACEEDFTLAERACARALARTPSAEPTLPWDDGPNTPPVNYVSDKEKKALLERVKACERAYVNAAKDEQDADERMRAAAKAIARAVH